MLDGWRDQQLARDLAFSTIEGREKAVRALTAHSDAFPWTWTPQPGPRHRMNTDHLDNGHYQYLFGLMLQWLLPDDLPEDILVEESVRMLQSAFPTLKYEPGMAGRR